MLNILPKSMFLKDFTALKYNKVKSLFENIARVKYKNYDMFNGNNIHPIYTENIKALLPNSL